MSYYQVEERPLAALAHPARKARHGGRLRQGQRRAQLRAARRSAPLAVRCPRRRSNRAATGIKEPPPVRPSRCAVCSRSAAARPALFAGGPACGPCQPRRLSLRCPPALRPPRPLRGVRRSSRSAASASRLPGSPLPSSSAACRPSAPLLRPWVLPQPRRVARPGLRAGPPARVPPVRRPAVPAAFPGGGAASGRSGRAGGGVRGLRPLLPGCAPAALARVALPAVFGGPLAGWGSPPYPPRPLPPLGAKGSAKPAASLRRDGRSSATAPAFSRPSPRCRCQPPPARRGPRARLTVRKLSTARFAAQRAPHFLPL